jgi:hypothetical protein
LPHVVAPATLNRPAGQIAAAGVALTEPAGHAKPALQLLHVTAPPLLKVPAEQMETVLFEAPANGHA